MGEFYRVRAGRAGIGGARRSCGTRVQAGVAVGFSLSATRGASLAGCCSRQTSSTAYRTHYLHAHIYMAMSGVRDSARLGNSHNIMHGCGTQAQVQVGLGRCARRLALLPRSQPLARLLPRPAAQRRRQ